MRTIYICNKCALPNVMERLYYHNRFNTLVESSCTINLTHKQLRVMTQSSMHSEKEQWAQTKSVCMTLRAPAPATYAFNPPTPKGLPHPRAHHSYIQLKYELICGTCVTSSMAVLHDASTDLFPLELWRYFCSVLHQYVSTTTFKPRMT